MKYQGIEYQVRMQPGQDNWIWSVHPATDKIISGQVTGTRDLAVEKAKGAIVRALQKARGKL